VPYFIGGLVFTGGLLGAQVSTAATYYVATTGNNVNPGISSQPVKTIGKGISKLQSGDTLVIKPGTYAERLENIPSGTSETNRTVIKAEQPGKVAPSLVGRAGPSGPGLSGARDPRPWSTSASGAR
jgi:TusA-related sulfurtransferase